MGLLNSAGSGKNTFHNTTLIGELQLISCRSTYYVLDNTTWRTTISVVTVNSELIINVLQLILMPLLGSFAPLTRNWRFMPLLRLFSL